MSSRLSYQTVGLLLIFLIGSLASCFQFAKGHTQTTVAASSIKNSSQRPEQSQSAYETASRLLDYGQGEKPSQLFHEILQDDLKDETKRTRVAVDLNNEAVALYLSARSQADRKRAQELLQLAGNCLTTAQALAQKSASEQTQMAVSYNQYMLLELLGEHSKAARMLDLASRRRQELKPQLSNGFLP